ncbi:hypothetical protein [Pseudomonas sp. NA-150]|uniref:hypothetical protein n=1 Tax=Pseudomonas sp. NA-150 TaxID=3367525 RepID=UPI0037CB08A8
MHSNGLIRDLLHLSLYLTTIVIWMHLWLMCVFNANGSLKRFFGKHAMLICALGVPGLAAILFGGAFGIFGREGMPGSAVVFGLVFPLILLQLLRRQSSQLI